MVLVATEVAFICETLRWSAMFACECTKRDRHHRFLLLRFSQLCQFVQNMCEADKLQEFGNQLHMELSGNQF